MAAVRTGTPRQAVPSVSVRTAVHEEPLRAPSPRSGEAGLHAPRCSPTPAGYDVGPGGYDTRMTTTPAEPVQDPDQQPIIQPDEPASPDTDAPGTGNPDLDPQR